MTAAGVVITGIILLLGIILVFIKFSEPEIINIENEKPKDKLDLWLDRLISYECLGCGPAFKRLDTNGEYSYSCLQFQEKTFLGMGRRYGLLAEGDDPVALGIYDCGLQRKIARRMFEDDVKAAARHWYYSIHVKGLGLPPT